MPSIDWRKLLDGLDAKQRGDHISIGTLGAILSSVYEQLTKNGVDTSKVSIYLIGGAAFGILEAVGNNQLAQNSALGRDMKIKAHDIDINVVCDECPSKKISPESFNAIDTDIRIGNSETLFGLPGKIIKEHTLSLKLQQYDKDVLGMPDKHDMPINVIFGYPLIIPKLLAWKTRRDDKST
ncbi:MAG: hypothetical protein ACP5TJ_00345, partial [Candidatus Micrarchaeia archaeon]